MGQQAVDALGRGGCARPPLFLTTAARRAVALCSIPPPKHTNTPTQQHNNTTTQQHNNTPTHQHNININIIINKPTKQTTISFGAILENVMVKPDTRQVHYASSALTENTRASYPITFIDNARVPCVGPHPRNVVLLCCDASGVLPPVSRLSLEQAMYHFISGYTSKVAGTEVGVTEPEATFSACYGGAFLMWCAFFALFCFLFGGGGGVRAVLSVGGGEGVARPPWHGRASPRFCRCRRCLAPCLLPRRLAADQNFSAQKSPLNQTTSKPNSKHKHNITTSQHFIIQTQQTPIIVIIITNK